MTKEMTIIIDEDDENVLLEIFKRFDVKVIDIHLTDEQNEAHEDEHE